MQQSELESVDDALGLLNANCQPRSTPTREHPNRSLDGGLGRSVVKLLQGKRLRQAVNSRAFYALYVLNQF